MSETRKNTCRSSRNFGILIFIILSIVLLSSVASAATVTYRFLPSTGATIATGITTNYGACGANPTTATITLLTTASTSGCGSSSATSGSSGVSFIDLYSNTAYSTNTVVTGQWYYGRLQATSGSSAYTFTFNLIYAFANGTVVVLPGSGTASVPGTSNANYNVSLTGITGTVPSGAKIGMRISKSGTSTARMAWFGDTADTNSQPSGYFSVTETPVGGAPQTYNLSGYVKNQSSGSPLSGALVQTNTSLNTTTNAQGYYIFSGLSNGTYIINASLTGYSANSTSKTINGANVTNHNISLTPIPTYQLSGYVTNQSSGAAISGATVTTNTSLSTTTNAAGFYNFTVSNGTYLVTASRTGYNDNSITRTVNGGPQSNANISLSPIPPSAGGKILVAANRYVVLDDPKTGSFSGTGFKNPTNSWSPDSITGVETTITMWAMLIDSNGMPLANKNVNFTLKNPVGTTDYTFTKSTDSSGLVNVTRDLNNKNYYGNWQILADFDGINGSTGFIYNWWGCGGGAGCSGHGGEAWASGAAVNSPYTTGHDAVVGARSTHYQTANDCMYCHLSYNGQGSTPTMNTSDPHRNITCTDSNCHGSITQHQTNMVIGSCSNCHNRTDIAKKNTLNGIVSNYSNSSSAIYNKYHTPNSTVPCIICHGPMHNISKPDDSTRFVKNNETETSQCLTCHSSYSKHNNSVNCTLCHSDDVHVIQVFAQNATYITLNKNNPNPARGNCTNCHQNATFLGLLRNTTRNPKAGNYSGSAPQVQNPLNHSNDPLAGQKWNNYWTAGSQYSACVYCHGSTQHDTTALGRPSQFKGTNTVGTEISNTTYWCSSCHWQGYTSGGNNYNDMVNMFISLMVPPEITGHSTYGANQTNPDYYNHSSLTSKDDATCQGCHGGLTSSTNITGLLHNVDQGKSGGPDCKSCHDIGGSAPKEIDINVIKNSTHKNLNGAISNVNLACYACHGDGTAPASGHPLNYKNPKLCDDCHTGAGNYSAPLVAEHNQFGQQVITNATCNTCHDNNGMFLPNAGTNGMTKAFVHYIKDITNRSTTPYQHFGPINTSNCITCHNNATYSNNASWGNPVNISTSTKRIHTETQTSQCDLCHNANPTSSLGLVDFHNVSVKLGDSDDCLSCHNTQMGQYPPINTSSFGKHKNVNTTEGGQNNLTNGDCRTCHYNTSNMSAVLTRTCEYCHTGAGIPNATIIDNHRNNGTNISTLNVQCSTCHNNSINKYIYTPNASIGHYATNTSLVDSRNCITCHKNSTNGTKWGGASDPWNSPTFPHSLNNTPKEDCYACHNNVSSSDFHNKTLIKPNISTVNCIDCHTTNRTMAIKEIDATVFGTGVHKNRTCENCHAGALDTNMKTYSITTDQAKTCTYCHTAPGNFSAPLIAEHNQVGQNVITLNATCNTCHDNSGMYLSNNGTNGTSTAVTHYLKDVTNRSTTPYQHFGPINTSNCITCHNNATYSNNASWGSPVNISTSTKRIHTETQTSQCDLCHNDGKVSSLGIVDFHNASVTLADMDNCLSCHNTAQGPADNPTKYPAISNSSFGKHKNVNTTNGTGILDNNDCKTCHYNTTNMSNVLTYTCDNCHKQGNFSAPIIKNHKQNGVNISTAVYCSSCHNNSINMFAYSTNASVGHYGTNTSLVDTANCVTCHKNSTNATKWGGATDPWNSPTFPHSLNNTPKEDCYACHNNVSTTDFHNVTLQKPAVSTVSCLDCHRTERTMAPKEIDSGVFSIGVHKNRACENCHADATDANMNTYSFATDPAKVCTYCHTGSGNFSAPVVVEHNQAGQDVITQTANCNSCHDNSGMYLTNIGTNGTTTAITHYLKDVTNRSTTPYQHFGPINTSNCIECHNGQYTNNVSWGSPVNISTSAKRAHTETQTSQCDACHNDGGVSSLGIVDFHNASIILADTNDCIGCHQTVQNGYPAINTGSFTKHKNINTTGGQNTLTNDDCTTCHYNFNYTVMSQTGFTTPTKVCTDCHTQGNFSAPIIKNHKPSGVNISTAAYCSDCHNNSVNMFAYSTNASVGHYGTNTTLVNTNDCTNCHKNSTNAAIWGGATDPWTSPTFPHSLNNTPKEDCYACHNNISTSDFHNITLQKPNVSTVNCIDCHTTNRTMAPKEIDAGVFSSGVHKNRACENCHANATDTNMNSYLFANDPAKICTYCHTGSGNFSAPLIAEHNQVGQDIITANATCNSCHDNSGMYLPNTGTNGTSTAITHYLKYVTDISGTPYLHNGPINTSNCIDCHNGQYTNDPNWSSPVNISTSTKRIHTETQTSQCDLCHNDGKVSSLGIVDFHNASVTLADMDNCLSCHNTAQGPADNPTKYPAISNSSFGKHKNINTTDGIDNLTNADCKTCHYNTTNMSNVLTYTCGYCHNEGNFSAPIIKNHQPSGVNISTAAYCSTCHNNSINKYTYSENASTGHYGTNTSLVKPTVNQSTAPSFGLATDAEASDYNKACNNCHNPSNVSYGSAMQIDYPHTGNGICNQCHVVGKASDLHNISLRIPGNYTCKNCHTNPAIASQFGAPDLTGTTMAGYGTCSGCHGGGDEYFDSLSDHNRNRTYTNAKPGFTDTVYLDGQTSLTVTKGAIVTITSRVNDSPGEARKVGGAEYYINTDPGRSRGIPMNATDGKYDATYNATSGNNWENVTATIDTSSLSSGTYVINVRGMDIGKQWSQVMNATLIVTQFGYINGTVTNESIPIPGVNVSTTGDNYITGSDGNYSLRVPEDTYVVNASKQPEFYDRSVIGVVVTASNTTIVNIDLEKKPTGTISGVVRNA